MERGFILVTLFLFKYKLYKFFSNIRRIVYAFI